MKLYPETVNGKPVYELSAHLLRRDFATRAVGHLHAADLDAILGHTNRDNEHHDFATFDSMRRIASNLEKCFIFDLQYTQSPTVCPICVNEASEFLLSGNLTYTIKNTMDSDLIVRGYVRACEPADDLVIQASTNIELSAISPSHPVDPPMSRKDRLICSRELDLSALDDFN